jgi:hypothetical protein
MKRLSYPPFIVFFDTIAILLFILILNQNKTIEITIPSDKIVSGAIVLYKNNNVFRNASDNSLFEAKEYSLPLACEQQIECQEARKKYGGGVNAYILLPDEVFNKIGKISILAFSKASCTSVEYVINKDGELDLKKLAEQNECLNEIYGFKEMVSKYISERYN